MILPTGNICISLRTVARLRSAEERRRKTREDLMDRAKRRAAEASQRALAMKDHVVMREKDNVMREKDHVMREKDVLMSDDPTRILQPPPLQQTPLPPHHHNHHQQQQRSDGGDGNASEQGLRSSDTGPGLGLGLIAAGLKSNGYDKKLEMLRHAEEMAWQREQEVSHRLHQADLRRQKVREEMLNRTRRRLAETAERTRAIRDAESHSESVTMETSIEFPCITSLHKLSAYLLYITYLHHPVSPYIIPPGIIFVHNYPSILFSQTRTFINYSKNGVPYFWLQMMSTPLYVLTPYYPLICILSSSLLLSDLCPRMLL